MANYQKFHPDLFTTLFNFEAIGVVTSLSSNSLQVTGHFRTVGDYVGLRFSSKDFWMHDYTKYDTEKNYAGTKFTFEPEVNDVVKYDDIEQQPACIVRYDDDPYYVTLGFLREKEGYTESFSFDGTIALKQKWITPNADLVVDWTKSETVKWIDKDGKEQSRVDTSNGTGKFGVDFDMDFVRGKLFTKTGGIPWRAVVTITYEYNTGNKYTLDFDKLEQGTHPTDITELSADGIDSITFPVIPTYFKSGTLECTGRSDPFTLKFLNMHTEGGVLNEIPSPMPTNPYRLAEGFDDEYNKNPKRLIEAMKLLGYEGIINLYIGASHFFDKKGDEGYVNEGVTTMYLDETVGINTAFKTWLHSYLKHMKLNGFDEFVTSVAMENLQMPEDWKQRMSDGYAGQTGWTPPTSFYSVNNDDVKTYIDKITCETLDIVVAEGFQPILQLGESWFWWQEFAPGDVNTPFPGRPPCFYDEATMTRFKNDMGYDLPLYPSSDIEMTEQNQEVAKKLQQYLGEYTEFMKGVAAKYSNSQFTILFFPPSVLDVDRVPEFLRIVNAPFEYWSYPNLDFIQIEDYDWVTREVPAHEDVFAQAWYDMDYDFEHQHYFSGFVLLHEMAGKEWPLIERAAQQALGRGYREVFIWAGTQIRRDSWVPKLNTYVSDCALYSEVNVPEEDEM